MATKKRDLVFCKSPYSQTLFTRGGTGSPWVNQGTSSFTSSLIGLQVTETFENPIFMYLQRYGKYTSASSGLWNFDRGNPFTTKRHFYADSSGRNLSDPNNLVESDRAAEMPYGGGWQAAEVQTNPFVKYQYKGRLFAYRDDQAGIKGNHFPDTPPIDESYLTNRGTTAVSRSAPTNPAVSLVNALGELKRDGLPDVPGVQTWQSRAQVARSAGSEYLNVEFGWKPLLSDIRKTVSALKKSHDLIEQYIRDAGRNIQRHYVFPSERSTEITDMGMAYPGPVYINSTFTTQGRLTRTRVTTKETWFDGCFTYYLSPGDSFLQKAKRYEQLSNQVLGTRITPEVLWNLTPWSWAADWVADFGAILANISAFLFDGQVLRYGYLMQTSIVEDTYTLKGASIAGRPLDLWQTFGTVSKVRRRATPYGFGLDLSSFTDKQWAILAALGLSRGSSRLGY